MSNKYPVPTYLDLYYIMKNNDVIGDTLRTVGDSENYGSLESYLTNVYTAMYDCVSKLFNKLGYSNCGYDYFIHMVSKVNMMLTIQSTGTIINVWGDYDDETPYNK